MSKTTLTANRLRELISYDPISGSFTWIVRTRGHTAGCVAGSVSAGGYSYIGIDGACYRAHRLAWLFVNGVWPRCGIDHINGNTLDNRIENLRLATSRENGQNLALFKNNKSGYPGVSWSKACNKWRASITLLRKQHHLGIFDDPKDAFNAYLNAKSALHPFNPAPRFL